MYDIAYSIFIDKLSYEDCSKYYMVKIATLGKIIRNIRRNPAYL